MLGEYVPSTDWHEVVYGRYGSIKTEHEQKYGVTVTLQDAQRKALKPGFDASHYTEICIFVEGHSAKAVADAVASYRGIVSAQRESGGLNPKRSSHRDGHHEKERNHSGTHSGSMHREYGNNRGRRGYHRERGDGAPSSHRDRDRNRDWDRDRNSRDRFNRNDRYNRDRPDRPPSHSRDGGGGGHGAHGRYHYDDQNTHRKPADFGYSPTKPTVVTVNAPSISMGTGPPHHGHHPGAHPMNRMHGPHHGAYPHGPHMGAHHHVAAHSVTPHFGDPHHPNHGGVPGVGMQSMERAKSGSIPLSGSTSKPRDGHTAAHAVPDGVSSGNEVSSPSYSSTADLTGYSSADPRSALRKETKSKSKEGVDKKTVSGASGTASAGATGVSLDAMNTSWQRVAQRDAATGETEYYYWNRQTNETTWDEPKYWKDYRSDLGAEVTTESTTEYTVSDADYRRTLPKDDEAITDSLESVLSTASS